MENNREQFQQQGTGSAENTSQQRTEQLNNTKDLSQQDKQDIADQINESPDAVTDLRELGQLSGRDDAAGGMGDDMENQSTGEPTDR